MKNLKSVLITALASAAVALAPTVIAAPGYEPAVPLVEEEETVTITGTVQKKAEKEITVKELLDEEKLTKIRLTDTTKFLKDGQPATAEDVTVGAKVTVKSKQDFLRRYEAVEITILPPATDPPPAL